MSFSDDTRELQASFTRTEQLLRTLLQGLQQRRATWISARPSLLQPSTELEAVSRDLAREEVARDALLARLRLALPRPVGGESRESHLNVTRIAAALPTDAGRALRQVGDAVQQLAKAVRTEVTLGQRLVRFAQHAQDGLFPSPGGAQQARPAAPGYDRLARSRRVGNPAGALVDGRM
jgi:hypothetical protein